MTFQGIRLHPAGASGPLGRSGCRSIGRICSGLGREGCVFPLRARDHLLGILVVGPRPDEHYAAEERELMTHAAHAVGASLFALQARATEEQLTAARAEAASSAARESALLDALRALGAKQRVLAER